MKLIPTWRTDQVTIAATRFKTLNTKHLRAVAVAIEPLSLGGFAGRGKVRRLTVAFAENDLYRAARKAWGLALDVNGWRER